MTANMSHKEKLLRDETSELMEQPYAIRNVLKIEHSRVMEIVKLLESRKIRKIYLVGSGDSFYNGLSVQYALEKWLKIPCEPIQSFDYSRYYSAFTDNQTLLIALSHSGTTQSTNEALITANKAGAFVLCIMNNSLATFTLETDTQSTSSTTKTGLDSQITTTQMALIYLLGLELAKTWKSIDEISLSKYFQELFNLPEVITEAINKYDGIIKQAADEFASQSEFFFVGGGPSFATANLGAAFVTKARGDHAFVFEIEEFHHAHGSIKKNETLFLIGPNGQGNDLSLATAQLAHKSSAILCALGETGNEEIGRYANYVFSFSKISECLTPIPYIILLQLFAYYLGKNYESLE